MKSVPVAVKPPGRRRTGFRCFWVAERKVLLPVRALQAERERERPGGMAATGSAAAAATGRFLVLLLLGLTAPAAALAGYIEVGSGRAPERSLLHPPWERGLRAGWRAGGLGASRAGRRGSGLRRVPRSLPRPCVVQC